MYNTTDTSERGLERLICTYLTGAPCDPGTPANPPAPAGDPALRERPASYGAGWQCGDPRDYDREYCIDLVQLAAFLRETQPHIADALALEQEGPAQRKFLARLQGEITKRGTIDVLRHGLCHGPHDVDLFYGTPSPGNLAAAERYRANRFTVTRQLRYSRQETQRALDLALLINGLPVATFELKNNLTKQSAQDAIEQYKRDRDPREKLFEFGRCVVHFAVDEEAVHFCTHLQGQDSWFLPFNKGRDDGAGNPDITNGLKTDYLWREILTREGLTEILENYAQIVVEKDEKTGRKKKRQIWPRYHQLDVVRRLLNHVGDHGVGQRYLIQHSAGSGKSNSIAWLAHQLIDVQPIGANGQRTPLFDSIVVITDRRLLDQQIRDTIKDFAQVSATVGHARRSGDLRRFLAEGKKIIISTVQKFPVVVGEISGELRERRFAILIDEAHSSQGGRSAAALSATLGTVALGAVEGASEGAGEDETFEDQINRVMEAKKLAANASYFAFTATPKNKTLEIFGQPAPQPDGTVQHHPFHSYSMKQAIEEGFILDVLRHYTAVRSYYRLIKTVEDDPEFDSKRAQKKLRRYVEGHEHAVRLKAEIMVDHFHEQVLAPRKIGGQARAMVVTGSIQRALQYYHAIERYLGERKSPHRAIVAFSGEHEHGGRPVTEASLNGFPSSQIPDKIQEAPYRFLVCADKFQTGYDEPLLHTMYVDKLLAGVKAVQTLSRLNRAHPAKRDVFVLDFQNEADAIRDAFAPYYRTTLLAEETDPNKLHDLQAELDGYQLYSQTQVDEAVQRFLNGEPRETYLDPLLQPSINLYTEELDEEEQVDFKGKARAFVRTHSFLSQILPYNQIEWEKRAIFLNFLVRKLPAPTEEDLSRGILEAIDIESYRVEKQAALQIGLPDEDAAIAPVPTSTGGHSPEPQIDPLSTILRTFHNQFGNIEWSDQDRIEQRLREIPQRVADDVAYQNAMEQGDSQNARIEHDNALTRVMAAFMRDESELFKLFMDNPSFKGWLQAMSFDATYTFRGREDLAA